jgi:hypothetical protein
MKIENIMKDGTSLSYISNELNCTKNEMFMTNIEAKKADFSIFLLNDKAIPIIPITIPVKEKLFIRKSTYMLIPEDRDTEKVKLENSLAVIKCKKLSRLLMSV